MKKGYVNKSKTPYTYSFICLYFVNSADDGKQVKKTIYRLAFSIYNTALNTMSINVEKSII